MWDDGNDIEKKSYHRNISPFDPAIAPIIGFFEELCTSMMDGKWQHYTIETFTTTGMFIFILYIIISNREVKKFMC